MKQGILYSMCWEDHDLLAQNTNESDTVLTVCSGGELAIEALLKNPLRIDVVDTNLDQLNLLRLKIALYDQLSYSEFIAVVGCFEKPESNMSRFDALKPVHLSEELKHWISVQQESLALGLIHAGKFDRYLKRFSNYILPLVVSRSSVERYLNADSLDEQEKIYRDLINNWRYRFLFKGFFGRFYMSRKGRHPDLLKQVEVNPADVFYRRMEHAWTRVPIRENYFMRMIIEQKWRPDLPIPQWLEEENFESIGKKGDAISLHCKSVMHHLDQVAPEMYDVIYLSDVTEILTQEQADMLFDSCHRAIRPNGKLIVWNNLVDRKPDSKWLLDNASTDRFWQTRKVSFYGFLGIYKRKEALNL